MSPAPNLRAERPAGGALDASRPRPAWAGQTSVVVVAYNSGDALLDCLRSIRYTEPDVEVVLVDNASTDGVIDRVEADFRAVRVVRNRQNLGFGAGNNAGAALARGRFLVFVNPDAVVTAGWLQALVAPLAEDESVGLVTPKVVLKSDPQRINVAGLNVHLSGLSMCRGLGAPRSAFDEEAEVAAVSGVAFAVRRDLFETLGGFDEGFFLYMEDVDLSLRTWLAGYRCLYVPQAVVQHEYSLRVDALKTFWVERGRYLMLLKALRRRTLLALLPTLLLAELITWGWVLWRNPRATGHKLRAWGWMLAHRAEIVRKRRRVQAGRAVPDAAFLARCHWRLDFAQLASPRLARASEVLLGPFLRAAASLV